jgi:hypothetical protein
VGTTTASVDASWTTAVPDNGNSGANSSAVLNVSTQSIAFLSLLAVVIVATVGLVIVRMKVLRRRDAHAQGLAAGFAARAAAKLGANDDGSFAHHRHRANNIDDEELTWEDVGNEGHGSVALQEWLRQTSQSGTERATRVHVLMESFNSDGDGMWDILDVGSFAAEKEQQQQQHLPSGSSSSHVRDAAALTRLAAQQLSFSNRINSADSGDLDVNGVDLCVVDGALTTKLPLSAVGNPVAHNYEDEDEDAVGYELTTMPAPPQDGGLAQDNSAGNSEQQQHGNDSENDIIYDLSVANNNGGDDAAQDSCEQHDNDNDDIVYDLSGDNDIGAADAAAQDTYDNDHCSDDMLYELCANGHVPMQATLTKSRRDKTRPAPRFSLACDSLGESEAG